MGTYSNFSDMFKHPNKVKYAESNRKKLLYNNVCSQHRS